MKIWLAGYGVIMTILFALAGHSFKDRADEMNRLQDGIVRLELRTKSCLSKEIDSFVWLGDCNVGPER